MTVPDIAVQTARALWAELEPVHDVVYFAPRRGRPPRRPGSAGSGAATSRCAPPRWGRWARLR
nr:hypothetical protein [Pseudonocardia sp. AL041005-10]